MLGKNRRTLPLIVSTAALLLLMAGCDFLATKPPGTLSEASFWKTEKDVRLFTNDLYTYLYGPEIFEFAALSDIATTNWAFDELAPYIRGNMTSESGFSAGQWSRNYAGIRRANALLAHADEVETDTPQLIERYKAEARFIRAYLYTYLTFWFGDVPLITEPISLEEADQVTRADQEKVWDFIASELQAAAEVLPVSYSGDNLGHVTKGAALAMRARAMLYAGRYAEAAEAAKAVMDLGAYSLYPSYEDLFTPEAEYNQGVILNKDFVKNTHPNSVVEKIAPASLVPGRGGDLIVPGRKIVDAYEMKNGKPIDASNSGFDPRNPYENRDPRLD